MTRFTNTTSDRLGRQNNRRLTRRERLYHNRNYRAGVHSSELSGSWDLQQRSPPVTARPFGTCPSIFSHNSLISLSADNPFEPLTSISNDTPFGVSPNADVFCVTKRKRTRGRCNKRGALLRQRQVEEVDARLSAFVDTTLEQERQNQSEPRQDRWLSSTRPWIQTATFSPLQAGTRSQTQCHQPSAAVPKLGFTERPLPMLYDPSRKESALIKWQPPRWSSVVPRTSSYLSDPQPPWTRFHWQNNVELVHAD